MLTGEGSLFSIPGGMLVGGVGAVQGGVALFPSQSVRTFVFALRRFSLGLGLGLGLVVAWVLLMVVTEAGTRAGAFTPMRLLRRLAAIVPPARWNQPRYFGQFAGRAKLRRKVVPAKPPPCPAATMLAPAEPRAPGRLPWALLIARTFLVDAPRRGSTVTFPTNDG